MRDRELTKRDERPGDRIAAERLSSVSRALPPVPAGVRASKNRVEATQTRNLDDEEQVTTP